MKKKIAVVSSFILAEQIRRTQNVHFAQEAYNRSCTTLLQLHALALLVGLMIKNAKVQIVLDHLGSSIFFRHSRYKLNFQRF